MSRPHLSRLGTAWVISVYSPHGGCAQAKLKEMEARLQSTDQGPLPSKPAKINSSHLASLQW